MPAVRDPDPAGVVHEPVELQLPPVPTPPENTAFAEGGVMSDRRLVAVVSGHVQGVGYRWFVRELASAAGLAGSARNLPDGRVEVVAEGSAEAVDRLLSALDGPRAPGTVTRVDHHYEPSQGSQGFTTE